MTTPEAARLLSVGATTIKRWVAQDRLKCVTTPGGHRRFERAELERYRQVLGGQSEDVAFQLLEDLLHDSDTYNLQSRLMALRGRLGRWYQVADVLGDTLTAIGDRWEQGTCSVAAEDQRQPTASTGTVGLRSNPAFIAGTAGLSAGGCRRR